MLPALRPGSGHSLAVVFSKAMNIPPFRLERFFAEWEFEAPYLLCASDAESMRLQDLLALEPDASDQLADLWLGYTETRGDPELRHEIAGLYDHVKALDVLVFSASEEAIFVCMHALLEPDDAVVVHEPCYQSLRDVASSQGCEVRPWRVRHDRDWRPDLDELRRLLDRRVRLLVVNFPHNPTGHLPDPETFRELVDICRQNGIRLFCDEMYRGFEYDPAGRLPAACDLYEGALSLGGMSKVYGLAGLRLGWIATRDRAALQALETYKDYTTICASAPSELLSRIAIRHRESIAARNRALVRGHLTHLLDFCERHQETFQCVSPMAGPVAFPRFLAEDAETFCRDLAQSEGVLLLPGSVFEEPEHIRFGFGRADFGHGLARLDAYLDAR